MIKYDYVWVGKIGETWYAKTTRRSSELRKAGEQITVYSRSGNPRTVTIVEETSRKVNPITHLVTQLVVVI